MHIDSKLMVAIFCLLFSNSLFISCSPIVASPVSRKLFLDCIDAFNLDHLQIAEHRCDKALKIDSENADVYSLRAMIKWSGRNHSGALLDFEKAMEYDSQRRLISKDYIKAIEVLGQRNYQGAIAALSDVIRRDSQSWYAYYQRGYIYYFLGKISESLNDFGNVVKFRSAFLRGYLMRAFANSAIKNAPSALADLDFILKIEPNWTDALLARGAILAKGHTAKSGCQDLFRARQLGHRVARNMYHEKCIVPKIELDVLDNIGKVVYVPQKPINIENLIGMNIPDTWEATKRTHKKDKHVIYSILGKGRTLIHIVQIELFSHRLSNFKRVTQESIGQDFQEETVTNNIDYFGSNLTMLGGTTEFRSYIGKNSLGGYNISLVLHYPGPKITVKILSMVIFRKKPSRIEMQSVLKQNLNILKSVHRLK